MIDEASLGYDSIGYNFCFVLYPDSRSYSYKDIFNIVHELNLSKIINHFAFILHDKDVVVESDVSSGRYSEDLLGTPRKPHFHLLVSFHRQKSYRSVLKALGLYGSYADENGEYHLKYPFGSDTAIVHRFRNYLNYMLHNTPDSKSKHRYYPDAVVSSDPSMVEKATSDDVVLDDISFFKEIVHFIDISGNVSMRDVYDYCCNTSDEYVTVYFKPKYYRTIKDFVDNHNTSLRKQKEVKLMYDRT